MKALWVFALALSACQATLGGVADSGPDACVPATTCPTGQDCGTASDNCGGTLSCGTCSLPDTCGGGGTANACGCQPTSCQAQGKNCGTISDGCGQTLNCGTTCPAGQTCGANNTPNVCGVGTCVPLTACPTGDNCGTLSDNCSGLLSCGPPCTSPQTCGGSGVPNVCSCTPLTSCPAGQNCGTASDTCGGTLNCGTCTAPATCGGAGVANVCGTTPDAGSCSTATPLVGCTLFATVGAFETGFLAINTNPNGPPFYQGCGGGGCHNAGSIYPPDLSSPNAYLRLLDVTQAPDGQFNTTCSPPLKYIDSANPANSLVSVLVHGPSVGAFVNCPAPSTGTAGQTMPRNEPLLDSAHLACVDAYIAALVGCK